MKIAFCTTCMNRLYQLKGVFDANVEVIRRDVHVEWVILNFGSDDDLDAFIEPRLAQLPQRFVYAKTVSRSNWHASIAKNIAHRVPAADCLFNLDCDNFIGSSYEDIRRYWAYGFRVFHCWSGVYRDGTCGRIGIERSLFRDLGGYDESMAPMGFQDRDLIYRASRAGFPVAHIPAIGEVAIRNDKAEGIRYCESSSDWCDMDRSNMALSRYNVVNNRVVSNCGYSWGEAMIEVKRGGGC